MAFVWVQQWIALPVVIEEPMGDLPSGSGPQTLDITAAGLAHDDLHAHQQQSTSNVRPSSSNTPFYSQLSSIPQSQLRSDLRSPAHATSPPFAQDPNATSFNMGALTAALPDYGLVEGSQPQQPVRQLSGASTSALVYQLQQNLQVHGQPSNALPVQSGYGHAYGAGQFQNNYIPTHAPPHTSYGAFSSNQQRGPGPSPMQGPYQNYPQQPQYMYYPAPYGGQPFASGFAGPNAQSQAMYGRRPSSNSSHVPMPGQGMDMSQQEAMYSTGHRAGPGAVQGDPAPMGWMPGGQFVQHSGKYSPRLVFETIVISSFSSILSSWTRKLHPSRTPTKAETIGTRPVGRQSTSRHDRDSLERPFLARRHERH